MLLLSVLKVTKLTETLIDTVLDIEFKPRIKAEYILTESRMCGEIAKILIDICIKVLLYDALN